MADLSSQVLIVDDFLDEEAWTEVWTHFQFAELSPVSRTAGAWKLGDGVPLGGEEIVTDQLGILAGSLVSALVGYIVLHFVLPKWRCSNP